MTKIEGAILLTLALVINAAGFLYLFAISSVEDRLPFIFEQARGWQDGALIFAFCFGVIYLARVLDPKNPLESSPRVALRKGARPVTVERFRYENLPLHQDVRARRKAMQQEDRSDPRGDASRPREKTAILFR